MADSVDGSDPEALARFKAGMGGKREVCAVAECANPAAAGGAYCISHASSTGTGGEVCKLDGCSNPAAPGSGYCAADKPPAARTAGPKPKAEKSETAQGCLITIAVIVVFVAGAWIWRAATGGSNEKGDPLENAYFVCQQFVGDRLKAPGSADYSPMAATTVTRGADVVKVEGWVDAVNGFGADLRTDYTCTVRVAESGNWAGKWNLVSMDMG